MALIILITCIGEKMQVIQYKWSAELDLIVLPARKIFIHTDKNIVMCGQIAGKGSRCIAMNLISAIFGHSVDHSAHCPAIFCIKISGNYLQILN